MVQKATDAVRLATALIVLAVALKAWFWLPVIGWKLAETHVQVRNQELQLTKLEQAWARAMAPEGLLDTRLQEFNMTLYQGINGRPTMTPWGPAHVGGLMAKLSTFNEHVEVVSGAIAISLLEPGGIRDTVSSVGQSINQLADRSSETVGMVNATLPLFTDCTQNADCLFNRWQGTAKSFERTMQVIERTAPDITESFGRIADNTAETTGHIKTWVEPKPWYKTPGVIGKIGVGLCRILC